MKSIFVVFALWLVCVTLVAAFTQDTKAFGSRRATITRAKLSSNDNGISRGDFLVQAGALCLATTIAPSNANAAKYGSLGAESAGVLNPKDAVVDRDILASEKVQKALSAVKGYLGTVTEMQGVLKENPQADLGPTIKTFDFVRLRDDLNVLNEVFDEDTQRGTDRLIRVLLQDVTELEISNKQKPGVPRSTIRYENLNKKLAKLAKAFNELLAFV